MPDPSRSGEEVETLRDYRDIELWKDVTEAQWNDWRWQVANRITTVEVLRRVIPLSDPEAREIQESLGALRMAITPYYATLIDPKDPEDPVRRQAVPSILETHVAETDLRDPLHEDVDSPVPGLAHRYPDRGILLLTDQCSIDGVDLRSPPMEDILQHRRPVRRRRRRYCQDFFDGVVIGQTNPRSRRHPGRFSHGQLDEFPCFGMIIQLSIGKPQ